MATSEHPEGLEEGLRQSAAGETVDLGSFAQYAEDEIEGDTEPLNPEVERILFGLDGISPDGDPQILEALRAAILEKLAIDSDPLARTERAIAAKYGVTDQGLIDFDGSPGAAQDRDTIAIIHCLRITQGHLRMIADDRGKLSSYDVVRYTSDRSHSKVFTPAEVAANCLGTVSEQLSSDRYPFSSKI